MEVESVLIGFLIGVLIPFAWPKIMKLFGRGDTEE